MTTRTSLLALLLAVALALSACGATEPGPAAEGATGEAAGDGATAGTEAAAAPDDGATEGTEAAGAPGDAATVAVAETDLGPVLVDGDGLTLYLFTPDEQGRSTCYDDCAATWPPLLGEAEAGQGADAGLLGSVEREGGEGAQVTYNDHPLYTYAGDEQPGDVNGQGVGGSWFAVTPSGEPAGDEQSSDAGGDDDDY